MGYCYKPKYKDRKTGGYLESSVWWIKYYQNGKPIRESSGSDKETAAKDLLKTREGDVVRGVPITPKVGRMKFSELAEDVVNDYKANGRRTLNDLESRLKLHINPVFGEMRAATIATSRITKFIADRRAAEASNGEINRELTVIKRAFSLGIQSGKILFRPHIPMLKENNVRQGFFEPDQFKAVIEKLQGYRREPLRPVFRFAYITGWRIRSEVWKLQWRHVDFEASTVTLDPGTTKNDEGRVFPFTLELRELLEAQRAETDAVEKKKGMVCPWVFHRNGNPIRECKRAWATACIAAGLPGKIQHDFRRTAVRNLVRAGIPEAVAMKMTGHKTRSVFERYNIVSPGDLTEAARKLDIAAGKVTGKVEAETPNRKGLSLAK
jgi:integrase